MANNRRRKAVATIGRQINIRRVHATIATLGQQVDNVRAEVTDAAMGSRAECVMLNKGPYIRETLRFLIDVLGRMEEHQHKKTSRLRKLHVSDINGSRARPTGASAGQPAKVHS